MTKNHYDKIEDWHQTFIEEQMMFFAATAGPEGRVNMAPKDAPSLRVMGSNRIVWVNLTGAENETGAHLAASIKDFSEDSRITATGFARRLLALDFCSYKQSVMSSDRRRKFD